jgi:hypothetical protein
VERLGKTIGPLDETVPRGERDLALFADAHGVTTRFVLTVLLERSAIVLQHRRPAETLEARDGLL